MPFTFNNITAATINTVAATYTTSQAGILYNAGNPAGPIYGNCDCTECSRNRTYDQLRVREREQMTPEQRAEEEAARLARADARREQERIQQEQWERREAENRVRREQEIARQRVAKTKAAELLKSYLDPEQVAQYDRDETFNFVGSMGGKYQIADGYSGNVYLMHPENGQRVASLCAHPMLDVYDDDRRERLGSLPTPDSMLAQFLALSTNEVGFHEIANQYNRIGSATHIAEAYAHLPTLHPEQLRWVEREIETERRQAEYARRRQEEDAQYEQQRAAERVRLAEARAAQVRDQVGDLQAARDEINLQPPRIDGRVMEIADRVRIPQEDLIRTW